MRMGMATITITSIITETVPLSLIHGGSPPHASLIGWGCSRGTSALA
jgi:hypothetical protein